MAEKLKDAPLEGKGVSTMIAAIVLIAISFATASIAAAALARFRITPLEECELEIVAREGERSILIKHMGGGTIERAFRLTHIKENLLVLKRRWNANYIVGPYADSLREFLESFAHEPIENTGSLENVDFRGVDPITRREDNLYSLQYIGFLRVLTPGTYWIGVDSDDASVVLIDGKEVVSWYGGHPAAGFFKENRPYTFPIADNYLFEAYFQEGWGLENFRVGWGPSAAAISTIKKENFRWGDNLTWEEMEVRVNGRVVGSGRTAIFNDDIGKSGIQNFAVGDRLQIFLDRPLKREDYIAVIYKPERRTLIDWVVV